MSTLTLVRHGQASLFASEYDQLSELGELQARNLGVFWVQQNRAFDAVFCGPRLRQQRTAELIGSCYIHAGLNWPTPQVLPELDEHEAVNLLKEIRHGRLSGQPQLQQLARSFSAAETPEDRLRGFQRLFEAVIAFWGQHAEANGIETWPQFRERVQAGIAQILAGDARGRRVAVFTSAGPITVGLQMALECADRTALELGWRLRNCSLSEFVFTQDRFSLDSFNGVPHLPDPAQWTHL